MKGFCLYSKQKNKGENKEPEHVCFCNGPNKNRSGHENQVVAGIPDLWQPTPPHLVGHYFTGEWGGFACLAGGSGAVAAWSEGRGRRRDGVGLGQRKKKKERSSINKLKNNGLGAKVKGGLDGAKWNKGFYWNVFSCSKPG